MTFSGTDTKKHHKATEAGTKRDGGYHLISQHQDSFEGEFSSTVNKKILKTRPQQIHNKHIVFPVYTTPSYAWDTTCIN